MFDNLILNGQGGKSITVDGNRVIIARKGSVFAAAREKVIPISNISGVEIKKPGMLINGYIQIQIAGQFSGNSSFSMSGGTYQAVHDENAVVFSGSGNYQIALDIQDYIEQCMDAQNNVFSGQQVSPIEQLKQLKQLLDQGIISEAEFASKKAKLMAQI